MQAQGAVIGAKYGRKHIHTVSLNLYWLNNEGVVIMRRLYTVVPGT